MSFAAADEADETVLLVRVDGDEKIALRLRAELRNAQWQVVELRPRPAQAARGLDGFAKGRGARALLRARPAKNAVELWVTSATDPSTGSGELLTTGAGRFDPGVLALRVTEALRARGLSPAAALGGANPGDESTTRPGVETGSSSVAAAASGGTPSRSGVSPVPIAGTPNAPASNSAAPGRPGVPSAPTPAGPSPGAPARPEAGTAASPAAASPAASEPSATPPHPNPPPPANAEPAKPEVKPTAPPPEPKPTPEPRATQEEESDDAEPEEEDDAEADSGEPTPVPPRALLQLEVAPALGLSPGGLGPGFDLFANVRLQPLPLFALSVYVLAPLAQAPLRRDSGTAATVRSFAIAAGADVQFPVGAWQLRAGLAGASLITSVHGQSASDPRYGVRDETLRTPAVIAQLGGAYLLSDSIWLSARALIGLAIPRLEIKLPPDAPAYWGGPFIALTLGFELDFFPQR